MDLADARERFSTIDTTAICDADKSARVMDQGIRNRSVSARMVGRAFTVRCRGDFLGVLQAVEEAAPGDVVVVDGGGQELALAGELFARGALVRGLAGIIVDAGYRDIGYVATCPLPIFSRFVTPRAGTTTTLGQLHVTVTCGGVAVSPGDIVLADEEGIVVAAPGELHDLLTAAEAIKVTEARLIEKLDAGSTLSDGLNLTEHVDALKRGEPSSLKFTT